MASDMSASALDEGEEAQCTPQAGKGLQCWQPQSGHGANARIGTGRLHAAEKTNLLMNKSKVEDQPTIIFQ